MSGSPLLRRVCHGWLFYNLFRGRRRRRLRRRAARRDQGRISVHPRHHLFPNRTRQIRWPCRVPCTLAIGARTQVSWHQETRGCRGIQVARLLGIVVILQTTAAQWRARFGWRPTDLPAARCRRETPRGETPWRWVRTDILPLPRAIWSLRAAGSGKTSERSTPQRRHRRRKGVSDLGTRSFWRRLCARCRQTPRGTATRDRIPPKHCARALWGRTAQARRNRPRRCAPEERAGTGIVSARSSRALWRKLGRSPRIPRETLKRVSPIRKRTVVLLPDANLGTVGSSGAPGPWRAVKTCTLCADSELPRGIAGRSCGPGVGLNSRWPLRAVWNATGRNKVGALNWNHAPSRAGGRPGQCVANGVPATW
mmetsp:Transcript_50561/g.134529  ORF Transcript_50561/g.134529 Transcript_50561/m.134529 type:complete len:367 (+) Transcript_50561:1640-2740(+)